MKNINNSIFSGSKLSQLKKSILCATLNNQIFQGSNLKLSFPDITFILTQSNLYLVDNDVTKTINIEKINRPLQIVSFDFIKEMAEKHGKVIYFEFQSSESEKDSIFIALEAKIFSATDQRSNKLSSIRLKIQKTDNAWKIIGDPTYLSA